jgi:hypothetical protein
MLRVRKKVTRCQDKQIYFAHVVAAGLDIKLNTSFHHTNPYPLAGFIAEDATVNQNALYNP